jgi:O-antigen biosynthesis protein
VACYCRGTHILTQSGDVRVEDLKIGDDVATRAGAFRPIKWIGKRSYSGRFAAGQKHILPICFKAGSLADNAPRRDLWISPHHAMYLEGVLIEAKDLVNDVSIVQAEHVESVEYFHIELDTHDVIIAEGALSETFVDDDSRGMFHNAHEYSLLYPEQRHQHEVHYCAPRCDSGYEVEAARQCIEARAGLRSPENARPLALRGNVDRVTSDRIEGWAQNPDCPEIPICLDIYLGDRLIGQTLANRYREDLEQAGLGSGRHSFTFVVAPGDGILSEAIQVRRSLDGAKIAPLPPAMRAHRRYAISAA